MDTNQELLDILKKFNDLDHKTDLKKDFSKIRRESIENLQYLFFESSCFKDIEYFHKGVSNFRVVPSFGRNP